MQPLQPPSSAPHPQSRPPGSRWPALVVWAVWLATFAAACFAIASFASPFPRSDDLEWVEALSPDGGPTLDWLWSAHFEHRIPLPRIVGLVVFRAFGDIRAVMLFDVALLAAAGAALIRAARWVRGRTSVADAAFPLLLLTPGGAVQFFWLHGISFLLPLALLVAILCAIARMLERPEPSRSYAIALSEIALPLCGGPGLATAPVLLAWNVLAGWKLRGSAREEERRSGNILLAGAAATALVIVLYFVGFDVPDNATWNPSPANVVWQAWRYLALGLGPAAREHWPWSALAVALAALLQAGALARAWKRDPRDRLRVAGLAAFSASIASMALVTALVRGTRDVDIGFNARYVPLPALWWCGVALALAACVPAWIGRTAGAVLIASQLWFLDSHVELLREACERSRGVREAFAVDVANGMGADELVERHWGKFHQSHDVFAEKFRALHDLGLWPALVEYARRRVGAHSAQPVSPARWETDVVVGQRWLEGQYVQVVAADSALVYDASPSVRRIDGRFGIHPISWEKGATRGIEFTVELTGPGAPPRVLFRRTLRPVEELEDRGFQRFSAVLPARHGAELVLRTKLCGESAEPGTWAFWTDVKLR